MRSKTKEAKKARRRKRQAARDARWIPDSVSDELEAGATIDLDDVNALMVERCWTFDDEFSDDQLVSWFFAPSGAEVDGGQAEPVTRIWLTAEDDGAAVHATLVGTAARFSLTPAEFFESLDVVEAYRLGDRLPPFG